MQIINPSIFTNFKDVLRWAQSVFNAFSGGISIITPTTTDATGVYNAFNKANLDGVMFRIGALGSGYPNSWSSGSACVINHGLLRQPVGFIVCDLDAQAIVWRTAVPTTDTINLATSNNAANVDIFVF